MQSLEDLDLARAHLMAQVLYRSNQDPPGLNPFEDLAPDMQTRLTYQLGASYEHLRDWLLAYREQTPSELDHFFSRIFGEVLSQAGFGFHKRHDAGAVAANLIESVRKFRWAVAEGLKQDGLDPGREYVRMVQGGVVAAQYVQSWDLRPQDAVLLAPAYTFLMANQPVDVQIWLEIGSSGWWERLYQPVTHPYVLSRAWPKGRIWSDADELRVRQEALIALTQGLIRRCRQRVVLALSDLGEDGYEAQGPLLTAVQRVLLDWIELEAPGDV
jgi:hypothetical protein